ncbi:MAG: hypothetical protein IPK53_20540 [bacterium]|nr:hypothetical protein [bacterium]
MGHYAMLEFNPALGDSVACAAFQDALTEAYDLRTEIAEKLATFEIENGLPRRTLVEEAAVTPATATGSGIRAHHHKRTKKADVHSAWLGVFRGCRIVVTRRAMQTVTKSNDTPGQRRP